MNVYTLPGANALKVAQEVRRPDGQMSQKFPPGLKYVALLDTSTCSSRIRSTAFTWR